MAELEVQKIKDLLDTGFISEEEYERRIKEILGDQPIPSVFRIGVSNAELLEENHLLAQLEQQLADVERRKYEGIDAHQMHLNKFHNELRANENEFVARLENLEKQRMDRRKRMQLLQDEREDLECLLSEAMELKLRIDVEARNGGDPLAYAAKKAEKESELQELQNSLDETEFQLKDLTLVEKSLACEIEDIQEQMDQDRVNAEKDLKRLTAEFKIKQEEYQVQIRCLVEEISALRDRVKGTPKKHAEEDEKRKRLAERSAMEQAEMLRKQEMELEARKIEEQRISMRSTEELERRSAEERAMTMHLEELTKKRAEEAAKKRAEEEVMKLKEEMSRAKEKEEEERMLTENRERKKRSELAMRDAMEMRLAEKMRQEEEYAVKARMEEKARRLAEEAELKNALEEAEYERSMRLKQEFQPSSEKDLEEELEELLGQVIKVKDERLGLEMRLKEISKRRAEEHLSLRKCEEEFARRREEEEYELRRRKKVLDELSNEEDQLADLVEERAARLIKVEQQLQDVTEVYKRRKTQN
jgi:hypothetical protein